MIISITPFPLLFSPTIIMESICVYFFDGEQFHNATNFICKRVRYSWILMNIKMQMPWRERESAGRPWGQGYIDHVFDQEGQSWLQLVNNNNNARSNTIILYIIICSIYIVNIVFGYRLLMKGDGRWLVRVKQQMILRLPGYTMHVGSPKGGRVTMRYRYYVIIGWIHWYYY